MKSQHSWTQGSWVELQVLWLLAITISTCNPLYRVHKHEIHFPPLYSITPNVKKGQLLGILPSFPGLPMLQCLIAWSFLASWIFGTLADVLSTWVFHLKSSTATVHTHSVLTSPSVNSPNPSTSLCNQHFSRSPLTWVCLRSFIIALICVLNQPASPVLAKRIIIGAWLNVHACACCAGASPIPRSWHPSMLMTAPSSHLATPFLSLQARPGVRLYPLVI